MGRGNSGGILKSILSLVFISLLFQLTSCSPRDVHVDTLKDRLDQGELVMITRKGERLPTCREERSDWQELRVHRSDYENFVVGRFKSSMSRGYQNCHRVGQKIFINSQGIDVNGSLGLAEVTGMALVNINQISREKRFLAKGLADELNFTKTVERLQMGMQPRHHGIVNVTFVKYVIGTSVLEAEYKEKLKQNSDIEAQLISGKIITLESNGEKLATCSGPTWSELRIHSSKYDKVVDGGVKTLLKGGLLNCHEVGQVIDINVKDKAGPLGKVKVTSLKLLSLKTLKSNLDLVVGSGAQAMLADDIARIESRGEGKPQFVSLINIDFQGGN